MGTYLSLQQRFFFTAYLGNISSPLLLRLHHAFDPPLCLPRRIVVLNSEQHPHPQHIHPLRPPLQDRGADRYGGGAYGGGRGGGMQRGGGRSFEPRPAPAPSSGVYVGNLLFDVTAADLEKEFGEFGAIQKVTLATDARGLSKGFGYVEFESIEQAAKAIEAKHESMLEGRRLVVNYMNTTRRENTTNPPSKTLFIGNLAFEMSDADLNKLFRDIRNVIDVRVAIDRRTGQPRGFAHADFVDGESAVKGKEALVGKEVYGRQLRIDFSAGSRESRGDGGVPRGDRETSF